MAVDRFELNKKGLKSLAIKKNLNLQFVVRDNGLDGGLSFFSGNSSQRPVAFSSFVELEWLLSGRS